MRKPQVVLRCVAESYNQDKRSRIIEFWHDGKGGLVEFFACSDGTLEIRPYRLDGGVAVRVGNRRFGVDRRKLKMVDGVIGSAGGTARAMLLSPERRSEIAKAAAHARWKKPTHIQEAVFRMKESA